MMILSDWGEDTAKSPHRLAIVVVGSSAEAVLRAAQLDESHLQMFVADRDLVTQTWLVTLRSAPTGHVDVPSSGAAAMMFVVGDLDGNLIDFVVAARSVPLLDNHLMVVVAALPPTFRGRRTRINAISELEALVAANAAVILLDSDHAFRQLDETDALLQHRELVALTSFSAVRGIADLITVTGEVNVDFADLLFLLQPGTVSIYTTGVAREEERAADAARLAVAMLDLLPERVGQPVGCVITITGDMSLSLDEVSVIAGILADRAGDHAEIIFGAVHDSAAGDEVTVSAIWTGYMPSVPLFERTGAIATSQEPALVDATPRRHRPPSRPIRVFVASPADLLEEREAAKDVVDELNLQHGPRWGTMLELVRWETHSVPAMGRAQGIITRSTGFAEIDIFVGLLWSRLGTPTGVAESGTIEEFNEAYSSWSKTGRPWIAFYFCDRPVRTTGLHSAEQVMGVARFREQFPEKGMYFTYTSVEQFAQLLGRHLLRIVEQVLNK